MHNTEHTTRSSKHGDSWLREDNEPRVVTPPRTFELLVEHAVMRCPASVQLSWSERRNTRLKTSGLS